MRGGKRSGAGRPKGTPNRRTAEQAAAVAASGLMPLDYMLQVMRDEDAGRDVRLDAAHKAAPYAHPKLANVEIEAGKTMQKLVVQWMALSK